VYEVLDMEREDGEEGREEGWMEGQLLNKR